MKMIEWFKKEFIPKATDETIATIIYLYDKYGNPDEMSESENELIFNLTKELQEMTKEKLSRVEEEFMEDWLKNLKVGDKVIVSTNSGRTSVQTITNITPVGNIKVGGILFTKYGSQRASNRWGRAVLMEYTEDLAQQLLEAKVKSEARGWMRKYADGVGVTLSLQQAEQILEILNPPCTRVSKKNKKLN